MIDISKIFFQPVELIRLHFHKWAGLCACFILGISVLNGVLPDIEGRTGICLMIMANLIVSAIVLTIWLLKRRIPRFQEDQIGILFGPKYQDKIASELSDIEEKLRDIIAAKDFAKNISIKRLPPNIKLGSPVDNIKIGIKANARLILSGNFETFTREGKNITGFSSISIITGRLPVFPKKLPTVLGDAVTGRQMNWDEENTIQKDVVAKNLSEIARYVSGLCLLGERRFKDAQTILSPLFIDIKAKYGQRRLSVGIKRFVSTISEAYVVSLVQDVSQEYMQELATEQLFRLAPRVIKRWEDTISQALSANEKNPVALMMLAIIRFLANDLEGAEEAVQKARNSTPLQQQLNCDFSDAFLLTFKGKLRDAKKLYKKIVSDIPDADDLTSVLCFIGQAISAFPDKPQLHFVYAFLNDELGDRELALTEFEEFLTKVNDENSEPLKRWAKEAAFRIERIKKFLSNEEG